MKYNIYVRNSCTATEWLGLHYRCVDFVIACSLLVPAAVDWDQVLSGLSCDLRFPQAQESWKALQVKQHSQGIVHLNVLDVRYI